MGRSVHPQFHSIFIRRIPSLFLLPFGHFSSTWVCLSLLESLWVSLAVFMYEQNSYFVLLFWRFLQYRRYISPYIAEIFKIETKIAILIVKWTQLLSMLESFWVSMRFNETQCVWMRLNESLWVSMSFNDTQWVWMRLIESEWDSMSLNEFQWDSMSLNEFQWDWMSLNETEWVWMGFHESQWVSMRLN